ncbi:ribokinase [Actinocrinis puniceicyclus]|uniref:ribokinase n=1 Tax=Actinocrinis puniceicyclus TaxID=977794 RepID=UPI003F68B62D
MVLGSANIDLVARCRALPGPGETVLATRLDALPGGKGANQAVAAARSGMAECAFLGAVGRDEHGARLREALRADGVDVSLLREVAGVPTGIALIAVDAQGANSIVVVPGANGTLSELTAAELDAIRGGAVVLAQLEVPAETVRAAFEAVHERGTREAGADATALTVLNAAPARPLDAALLAVTDLLVVNEIEAAMLTGSRPGPARDEIAAPWDLCAGLLELAPRVVLTLGEQGACFADRAGTRHQSPAAPARAVDTTAAGDTFAGVFAAALAARRPAVVALRYACAAASLSVEMPGAIASIPTAARTAERYREAYGAATPAVR